VLVEGSGGLLVRLDSGGGTLADLARRLGTAVLVVARPGLGTLNHTALSCEALRHRDIECAGIVLGAWPAEPDLASRCNRDDLPTYAGAPLLGMMPESAGALAPDAFLRAAEEGLAGAAALIERLVRAGRPGEDVHEDRPDEVLA
jgi:dethiobiotin synthetase